MIPHTREKKFNISKKINYLLPKLSLIIALTMFFALGDSKSLPTADAAASAQQVPTLIIDAPRQVTSDDLITLQITLENAGQFGGYEAAILYDTTAAEFAGFVRRENATSGGRDTVPLIVVHTGTGSAVGQASCRLSDCISRQGSPAAPDVGTSNLIATLDFIPLEDGMLEIKFDAVKFVDLDGNPFPVQIPNATLAIQVGDSTATHPAPAALWSLVATQGPGGNGYDITRPGIVTYSDAMQVAVEWTRARESGEPCANISNIRTDVNEDGCIDVADVQAVLANLSPGAAHNPGANEAGTSITFTVNSTGDESDTIPGDGVCRAVAETCTLRAAIQEGNAHIGPDTIHFNIPGGGVKTIQLTRTLDSIHDSTGGLTIDGYSQPSATQNNHPTVSNARIRIEIAGQGRNKFGAITITSANNMIRGLAFYNLRRSLWLYGAGASNNSISGNFIGTNVHGTAGTTIGISEAHGIKMELGAHDNVIGGTNLQDRNVISGNANAGIGLWHGGTAGNIIVNNIVGLAPNGASTLANAGHGVDLNFGAARNRIGGPTPGERNVISANWFSGVEVSHEAQTKRNRIEGNYIGTNTTAEGVAPGFGNQISGISIRDRVTNNSIHNNVIANNRSGGIRLDDLGRCCISGNQITNNRIGVGIDGSSMPNGAFGIWVNARQTEIGPDNIIANSTGPGIQIEGNASDRNRITRNMILKNQGLGIDITPLFEVNPNDAGDFDSGPNEQLNFPVIETAIPDEVKGTACANCTVEIYLTDAGTDAHGEAGKLLAFTSAQPDGRFTAAISSVNVGQFVTAIAIDASGNTSEFAQNAQVTSQPVIKPTLTPPPEELWQSVDIGTMHVGSTTTQGNSLNIRGSGKDVWSKADSFRYVYQSRSGNVQVSTYLSEWDGESVNAWAKAGLMIRSSTEPGAANMFIMVTGNDTVRMQWRSKHGRKTHLTSGFQINRPIWLKLVKSDGWLSAYFSEDNINWTQVGNQQRIELGETFMYGPAVTPHGDRRFVNATFHQLAAAAVDSSGGEFQQQGEAAGEEASVKTIHIGEIQTGKSSDGNTWLAVVDLTVHNLEHRPLRYATVFGRWVEGASGRAKCTTDATGRCALLVQELPDSAAQVKFEFTRITRRNAQYQPDDNHWRKRSGATFIKVKKPKN